MHTPIELLTATAKKVQALLEKEYTDYTSFDAHSFSIESGSSRVMIIIRPFTDTDTCIEFFASLVSGAIINDQLLRYLLRKNAELHFGAFSLLFDDTICYSHTISGINADENEILTSIKSVALIADYYDDEIVAMAGGKRAKDDIIQSFE